MIADPNTRSSLLRVFVVKAFLAAPFLSAILLAASPQASAAIATKTAVADGVTLQYLEAGSGPAVILLHGYAETSRMWRPLMPQLATDHRVIAPDLPGIGESSVPTDGLDMKSAATRIHSLARQLGIDRAVVVGHDIGLMVAYAYAAQFPGETEKLAVMDAFPPGVPDGNRSTIIRIPGIFVSTASIPKN
jgi:pimeloyl-ACP methyl ester carboxylesterase